MSRYTMRYIAKQVSIGLFDSDIYLGIWNGAGQIVYALLTLVGRSSMLLLFPVSVPALWAFFKFMGPINERRRVAARKKMVERYQNAGEKSK